MTLAELVVILCAIRGIAKGGNGDASSGVRSPRKSDAATEMQRNGILVMKTYFNDLVYADYKPRPAAETIISITPRREVVREVIL
jgi:hypothetical protein